jgi:hypothetical protein
MSRQSPPRRSLARWLTVPAAVLALGLAGWVLFRRGPAAPEAPMETIDRPTADERPIASAEPVPEPVRGGLYEGRVVDDADAPIAGAEVLLVADAGPQKAIMEPTSGVFAEPLEVMVYGNHVTANRGKTDAQGRFSLSAGDRAVVAVMAVHTVYSPGLLTGEQGSQLAPGSDLVVRLHKAGRLHGTVVDAESREPVRGAKVVIFVQNVANLEAAGPRAFGRTNAFAQFQTYIERELAPTAWGIEPIPGENGLNVRTGSDGRFQFGPISNEVQLQVVVDHPDYKWEEFGSEVPFPKEIGPQGAGGGSVGRLRRIVIEPGQVLEQTFAVHRGNEVTGVVVDEQERPVPGVLAEIRHIVQVSQMAWYRDRPRKATADSSGRFRVAGLDMGDYELTLRHPSFGVHIDSKVPDDAKAGRKHRPFKVASAGWIEGRIEGGGPEDPRTYGALVHLEPTVPTAKLRPREQKVLVKDGAFRMDKVPPGAWRIWAEFGERVSMPVPVEVSPASRSEVTLSYTAAASVLARLVDSEGKAVDPATLSLRPVDDGVGGGEYLARQGVIRGNVTLPGRYEAFATASGFLDEKIGPFDLQAGVPHDLGTIQMHRRSFLKIVSIVDETGRGPSTDVTLLVGEGGKPATRRMVGLNGLVVVEPGQVEIRATMGDRSFEQTLDVGEGQTVEVRIRLSR